MKRRGPRSLIDRAQRLADAQQLAEQPAIAESVSAPPPRPKAWWHPSRWFETGIGR